MKTIKNLFLIFCLFTTGTIQSQHTSLIFSHKVGDIEVTLLSETQGMAKSNILIDATPEMFKKYAPDGTFPNAVNTFLLRTPENIILVDAGFGSKLFKNMQSLGVKPEQVNILALTHMHGDHIGGMLRDGKAAFPNAEIYLSEIEYNYWTSEEEMKKLPENKRGGFLNAQNVIKAYKGRIHLISPNEAGEIANNMFPYFYGIAAYGHTPGHTMFMVESGNDKMLIWGDLTHAMAIQMPYPRISVTYDADPKQARISREKVLDYVSRNNIPIAGMHIAFPGMGTIIENNMDGYLFAPVNLEEKVRHAVLQQLKNYPASRLQDIYKNFFQDYFGPGHLLHDTVAAANYLRRELASYTAPSGMMLEETGWEGNFYRVNLVALKEHVVPFQLFFDAFVESANKTPIPPAAVWKVRWNEIIKIIDRMQLTIPDYKADKDTLTKLLLSNQLVVHHSDTFNHHYHPHYRIIGKTVFEEKLRSYFKDYLVVP
jgi:glyoxylase-like metal-dependent hydrolase (beta-lactamase superfamily II)